MPVTDDIAGNADTRVVFYRSQPLDPAPSQKIVNHSPDGFAWGYEGSGPAQLALAILLRHTGDNNLAVRDYQLFKRQVIAGLTKDKSFTLSISAITEWLAAREGSVKPREPKTDEELREIALGIAAGTIFSDAHLPKGQGDDMFMHVFMPLMFMDEEQRQGLIDQMPALFYENIGKAGPRSINGYPTFLSVQYLTISEVRRMQVFVRELRAFTKGETA